MGLLVHLRFFRFLYVLVLRSDKIYTIVTHSYQLLDVPTIAGTLFRWGRFKVYSRYSRKKAVVKFVKGLMYGLITLTVRKNNGSNMI